MPKYNWDDEREEIIRPAKKAPKPSPKKSDHKHVYEEYTFTNAFNNRVNNTIFQTVISTCVHCGKTRRDIRFAENTRRNDII
jgi:hypothetical protein